MSSKSILIKVHTKKSSSVSIRSFGSRGITLQKNQFIYFSNISQLDEFPEIKKAVKIEILEIINHGKPYEPLGWAISSNPYIGFTTPSYVFNGDSK